MKIQIKSLLFLTLGFSFLITSCSRNPVTGKKELSLMSESQEKSMGLEYDPQIQAEYGMYADSSWQRYLREKGGSMARISHRPNLGFQFRVIDSEVVNAFAVPGGYIYFTRGILAHFNSEAQLMGVMGHEIGHVTARHANEQYSKQMLAQIGLIAGMVLSPKFREFSDLANSGVQMLFLKFSRDNESQSDKLGVEYSSKVGYDAAHMADFFKTLGRLSDAQGARIPSFMSTHPDPGDRYNKVKTMAVEKKKEFPQATKVERNAYLNRLDGMIYGKDPKQVFKEGDVFYHPELKFQFPTPNDWAYENTPSKVQFSTKDQKAIMVLSLAAEKDLNSAASAHISHYKLKTIRQDRATVNGLSAIYILAELPPEQQAATTQEQAANTLRVGTMLILHNGMVFNITGVTAQNDYNAYESSFNKTMNGFKILTDPSKLNVKPEKIAIKTVNKQMSLRDALNQFNQDSKRHDELSILNGMLLTDAVSQGTLIKTITK
ncbi:MAG: M48 family metalloprotease [Saprospiraceae bacterium]|nr:M48 family metalloprotease [Saprospiraceae bacterium]